MADSTPRTENRLRSLFWPTIRSVTDLEYIARQGFWICLVVSVVSFVDGLTMGQGPMVLPDVLFYFLAAMGVRERNRYAAAAAVFVYLLSGLVLQRYTGQGFGVIRIVFLALLLSNARGTWLASRWVADPVDAQLTPRCRTSVADRLCDQLPAFLWPKTRIVFYVLPLLEVAALLFELFVGKPI